MKAAELRIGNYVNAEHKMYGEKYIVVESVGFDSINISFRRYLIENIEPIPLTEEWLLRFGFEELKNKFYTKGRMSYHAKYGWKILEKWVSGWLGVQEIKYVHQLQNLYFALSGEELTLNNGG